MYIECVWVSEWVSKRVKKWYNGIESKHVYVRKSAYMSDWVGEWVSDVVGHCNSPMALTKKPSAMYVTKQMHEISTVGRSAQLTEKLTPSLTRSLTRSLVTVSLVTSALTRSLVTSPLVVFLSCLSIDMVVISLPHSLTRVLWVYSECNYEWWVNEWVSEKSEKKKLKRVVNDLD